MQDKTDEQILEHIEKIKREDFFGFITRDLIGFLSFENAKSFLKEGVTKEEWIPSLKDRGSILKQMEQYMNFAWDKANNCRGLSAGRSLDHMAVWLWMIGEEEAADAFGGYSHYGKPHLRAICEHFDWDWRSLDDGKWRNREDDDGVSPEQVAHVTLPWREADAR